jgi:hypothetical protein
VIYLLQSDQSVEWAESDSNHWRQGQWRAVSNAPNLGHQAEAMFLHKDINITPEFLFPSRVESADLDG